MEGIMKIDAFCHIMPKKYLDALQQEIGAAADFDHLPSMYDLDVRFRIMDKFDDLMQVLSVSMPAPENIKDKGKVIGLAKLANDELAELVHRHPDRFAAGIACLPMNDMDAALLETDRAIKDLKMRGVQISTPILDKPLDSPEFIPLYEKMWQYNLPIYIHPQREPDYPEYRTEKMSKHATFMSIGWPFETSAAVIRLIFSGIMEKFPGLKFILHHSGAMMPFLYKRLTGGSDYAEMLNNSNIKEHLRKPTIDYIKMFYADTAIWGNTAGLQCAHALYGTEHLIFGTDFPYDDQWGLRYTRETIDSIKEMGLCDADQKMVFEENARRLLRLTV
jgi:predicted TIM-barrel fold metal-dependent hydrolase